MELLPFKKWKNIMKKMGMKVYQKIKYNQTMMIPWMLQELMETLLN